MNAWDFKDVKNFADNRLLCHSRSHHRRIIPTQPDSSIGGLTAFAVIVQPALETIG